MSPPSAGPAMIAICCAEVAQATDCANCSRGTSNGASGVYLECEVVSLSRSVPRFVGKMVSYFTSNSGTPSWPMPPRRSTSTAPGRRNNYPYKREVGFARSPFFSRSGGRTTDDGCLY